MILIVESEQEASFLKQSLRSIRYNLGPLVELTIVNDQSIGKFSGGTAISAQCATLNERIESIVGQLVETG